VVAECQVERYAADDKHHGPGDEEADAILEAPQIGV
jgi:hypothetical protein